MNNRNWCLLAAAAAIVAIAPTVARADDTSTNPAVTTTQTTTTSTTTVTAAPILIPTIAPAPVGPNGQPIDFTVLADPRFNYSDLKQAHNAGFTDYQVAEIAKIAYLSGEPFNHIEHLALDGLAFPTIADMYNIRYGYIRHAEDYRDRIYDYKLAYENSGEGAVRQLIAGSQQEMTVGYNGAVVTADDNIADIVRNSPDLTMFARALRTARVTKILRGPGPYTVFAPNDSAFAKLSADQVNSLMSDQTACTRLVDYCIIPSRIDAAAAMAMTTPTSPATLEGDPLQVTSSGGSLLINGATVVRPDVYATNGVVHVIDTVLMPPSVTTTTTTTNTTTTTTPTVTPMTTITPTINPNPNMGTVPPPTPTP